MATAWWRVGVTAASRSISTQGRRSAAGGVQASMPAAGTVHQNGPCLLWASRGEETARSVRNERAVVVMLSGIASASSGTLEVHGGAARRGEAPSAPHNDGEGEEKRDGYFGNAVEQCGQFHRADVIVAPHGAALTNLLCARPASYVVELQPSTNTNLNYMKLAADLSLNYHGMHVTNSTFDHPMHVSITQIRDVVSSLLQVWAAARRRGREGRRG